MFAGIADALVVFFFKGSIKRMIEKCRTLDTSNLENKIYPLPKPVSIVMSLRQPPFHSLLYGASVSGFCQGALGALGALGGYEGWNRGLQGRFGVDVER